MDMFGLGIYINYEDRASEGLKNTSRVFNETQKNAEDMVSNMDKQLKKYTDLARASTAMTIAGVGVAGTGHKILGALSGATKEATSFEKELNQLKFVTGATTTEFEELRKVAVRTGIDTAFSPQEAVQAMYELKSAGMDTNQMLEALQNTLNLVAVSGGEISLASGATLVANTLNKFNLDAKESVRVVDMLSQATKETNFHFQDLSAFMNSLGSAPATLKRPLEEYLAMGGLLRNIGQQSAQAGSTVAGFARKLAMLTSQLEHQAQLSKRPAGQIKFDAMKQLGLDKNTIWDAKGNVKSMVEIFGSLTKQMANMSEQQKATVLQTVFADQAKNMVQAVDLGTKAFLRYDEATGKYVETTKDGKKTLEELVGNIKNANGVTAQGAEDILKTQWGIQKLWEGTKQTFGILLGNTVLPIIGRFLRLITKATNKLIDFGYAHPVIMKVLGYGMGLAGLLLVVGGAMLIVIGTLGNLISGVGIFTIRVAELTSKYLPKLNSLFRVFGFRAGSIKGNILNLLPMFKKLALGFGTVYIAWKTDFMGIRSLLNYFMKSVYTAWSESTRIAGLGSSQFVQEVSRMRQSNTFVDAITYRLLQLKVLWIALCEAWNTNELSDDTFEKANELGLIPLISTILDCKQRVEEFCKGFMKGFQEVSDFISNIVSTIITTIKPVVDKLWEWVSPLTGIKEKTVDVNEAVGGIDVEKWQFFGRVVGWVAGIFIATSIASKIFKIGMAVFNVVKRFSFLFKIVKLVKSVLLGLFSLGPIGVFIAVVGTLVTVFTLLYKKCEPFRNFIDSLVQKAIEGFQWIKEKALGFFEWVSTKFTEFGQFVSTIADGIKTVIGNVWDGIVLGAKYVVAGVLTVFILLGEFLQWVFGGIKDFALWAWNGISDGAKWAWEGICSIAQWVADTVMTAWAIVEPFFSAIWNGICDGAKYVWDNICGFIQWVADIAMIIWSGVKSFFDSVWDGICIVAQWVWDTICNVITTVADIVMAIWSVIQPFFDNLWNSICIVAQTVWNIICGIISLVASIVQTIWNGACAVILAIWDSIKSGAESAWNAITGIVDTCVHGVKTAWNGITGFFSGIWDNIKQTASDFFNWLSEKFSWVTGALDGIKGAFNWAGGKVSGAWDTAKKMVGLNTGGYVKTTGIAVLHPNEVVVNDTLTQRLGNFLEQEERGGRVVQAIAPPPSDSAVGAFANQFNNNVTTNSVNNTNTSGNQTVVEEGAIQINIAKGDDLNVQSLVDEIYQAIKRKEEVKKMQQYA